LFKQRTIAEKITCTGIGLHTGAPVELALAPALAGTGVVFASRQGDRLVEIAATPENLSSTANATTLSAGGASVATVEHLLAALRSLGVDNVRIEIDGPEVPVMDGSAASFDYLIRTAGLFTQPEARQVFVVRRAVTWEDGLRSIRFEPSKVFRISYAVDFEHPAIGRQEFEVPELTQAFFEKELARARTFGFLDQVDALRRAGLARGGSLLNTVVLDESGVINEGGLRWPDEFVRHKVLDLLGDVALLGRPIRAHISVERGGHALHHAGVAKLLAQPDSWKLVGEEPPRPPGGEPAEYLAPI
jgi:UDP-3-O-[3-hydroxymyristoyl] N-acetylglucosamine deacetylase